MSTPPEFTDCDSLQSPRQKQICRGEADIPETIRRKYLVYWGSKKNKKETVQTYQCHGECPGTELKMLLLTLGIARSASCACDCRATEMNKLGVDRIRKDKEIWLKYLTEAYHTTNWWQVTKAATIAVALGLPKTIEGLLDEALRRAEAKGEPKQPESVPSPTGRQHRIIDLDS